MVPTWNRKYCFMMTPDQYIESNLDWVKSHKLEYLPIPKRVYYGMHERHSESGNGYQQFIVLEQYGSNITKLLKRSASGKFNTKTICYIALRMLEALECIHAIGSVHADINGCNIVTGYTPADKHKVYLIDYGRVFPFGTAKEEYCILRPEGGAHDWGTLAYTSVDVHNGEDPAQRGDMEILGYNIMEWAGVKIPWLDYSDNEADTIAMQKNRFKSNLLDGAFSIKPIDGIIPEYILTYMCAVYQMEYLEKPDYESLKSIFRKTLEENNLKDDKNDLDWITATSA